MILIFTTNYLNVIAVIRTYSFQFDFYMSSFFFDVEFPREVCEAPSYGFRAFDNGVGRSARNNASPPCGVVIIFITIEN